MDDEVRRGYCPCCQKIHQQEPVGVVGGTQADGCDVDFTIWRCAGCGSEWSGDLYDSAQPTDCA